MRLLCVSLAIVVFACASASESDPTGDGTGVPSAEGGQSPSIGAGGAAAHAGNGGGGAKSAAGGASAGSDGQAGSGGGAQAGGGGAHAGGGGNSSSAGAAGAGGGGGGAGGTPSHMSGNCSTLAGSAGKWEAIAPPGITDTTSVVVDPFDDATVWLGTSHKGFYKSTDCGANWTHIDTGANSHEIDAASLWSIAVDPVAKGTIYVVGAYGALGLFKSTNGGVDFQQVFTPDTQFAKVADQNFVNNVSMDPTNHLHLVVMEHGGCTGFNPSCEAETTDGGATWKLTATPQGWGEGGGVQLINAASWLWGGSEGATGTWLTTDNGKSWGKLPVSASANGEFTIRPLLPASDGAYYVSSLNGVLRSPDGKTWATVDSDRTVGFAIGDTKLYAIDQWSPSFRTASIANPKTWTKQAGPSGFSSSQGCPYLDYDPGHHVLYASCFSGALWRLAE